MNVSYAHGARPAGLQDVDRRLFKIIETFIRDYDYSPSIRELADLAKISSSSQVVVSLRRLEAAGAIGRRPGRARTIVVLDGGVCG